MLLAAAGGLVTEFTSNGLIWKQSRHDLNARGALWRILRDAGHLLMEGTPENVNLAEVSRALQR